MHVILGAGNLGCDIMSALIKREIPANLFSITVNNWKYPCSLCRILDKNPEHIWVCVGSVSPILKAYDTNLRLAIELMEAANKNTFLHFFSVITKEDKKDNEFYNFKKQMEFLIESQQRPNTNIYRVPPLHGNRKPNKYFSSDKNMISTEIVAEQVIEYAIHKKWVSVDIY